MYFVSCLPNKKIINHSWFPGLCYCPASTNKGKKANSARSQGTWKHPAIPKIGAGPGPPPSILLFQAELQALGQGVHSSDKNTMRKKHPEAAPAPCRSHWSCTGPVHPRDGIRTQGPLGTRLLLLASLQRAWRSKG